MAPKKEAPSEMAFTYTAVAGCIAKFDTAVASWTEKPNAAMAVVRNDR